MDFTDKPFITWSSPTFYSNDIPRENIATYHVIVQNQDGSIIVDDNTTDTFYQLPSNLTDCGIYTASVRAFIEQYSSLATTITEQYTRSKIITIIHLMYCYISDYTIDILEHIVEFEKSGNSSIEVQFPVNVRTNVYNHMLIHI